MYHHSFLVKSSNSRYNKITDIAKSNTKQKEKISVKEIIISIVLSLISSFCYDTIKNIIQERNRHKSDNSIPYSPEYIKAIKKQFYISFPLGILFLYFSSTSNEFLKLFNLVMSFFSFFFALMAFMCSIDVINHFTNKHATDDIK